MATINGTSFDDYIDFYRYGISNDRSNGNSGDDWIRGWSGNDSLDGSAGNDWLEGEAGNDTLLGGSGFDWLDGGSGADSLYGGSSDDTLLGYTGNDRLSGGSGDDVLDGETGADFIYGGTGVDDLWGGADNSVDRFYFATADTGSITQKRHDIIYDFTDADGIYLQGSYTFNSSGTRTPANGQYSIWQNGDGWVVTYNSPADSVYHDILVYGANPRGDIFFFT
ncbi:calcium-binding protein [Microvirga solisilvae]|uniref:calcium-binding protein n=1 Tax=Microvirga solisilvae TaxID=2919498 RepID=UPI001FAEEC87|nr:calcium-binding protein [Microvirga solisilvae]